MIKSIFIRLRTVAPFDVKTKPFMDISLKVMKNVIYVSDYPGN